MGISKKKLEEPEPLFPAPFALFIGPQRAGTSWMYEYFLSRPDICVPEKVKEIFFFDHNYEKGFEYYSSFFTVEKQHKLALEVTTTSFHHPEVPDRIAGFFGKNIKLVCPLRHPITRSYSLYKHYLRYGIVEGSLEEAVEKCPDILKTSAYSEHLANWYRVFDKDNILICFQEYMSQDREAYLRNICAHLGIPYQPTPDHLMGYHNVSTRPPSVLIANMAQKGADFLRSQNMYGIINFAKALGLKKYIFGAENPKPEKTDIPRKDLVFLEEKLAGEVEKLEAFLGAEIPDWKQVLSQS